MEKERESECDLIEVRKIIYREPSRVEKMNRKGGKMSRLKRKNLY